MKKCAPVLKVMPYCVRSPFGCGGKWGLMKEIFRQVTRPVCAFLKRWGSPAMKRYAWKQDFERGINIHHVGDEYRSSICDWIEKYAMRGDILDLGCSDGHVGLGLALQSYKSYTGVDISDLALNEAQAKLTKREAARIAKNRFFQGEITSFEPEIRPSVVLFKDSLYYLNKRDILKALKHYREHLVGQGVFVVQMNDVKRHGWIRDLIIKQSDVVEDLVDMDRDLMILVFR